MGIINRYPEITIAVIAVYALVLAWYGWTRIK
jgi:hypothetical protein